MYNIFILITLLLHIFLLRHSLRVTPCHPILLVFSIVLSQLRQGNWRKRFPFLFFLNSCLPHLFHTVPLLYTSIHQLNYHPSMFQRLRALNAFPNLLWISFSLSSLTLSQVFHLSGLYFAFRSSVRTQDASQTKVSRPIACKLSYTMWNYNMIKNIKDTKRPNNCGKSATHKKEVYETETRPSGSLSLIHI